MAGSDDKAVLAEVSPLIGNRRQGPDRAQIGSRRSVLWLKAHSINPPGFSPNSILPSYPYLFSDERGSALVAYLKSLGQTNIHDRYLTAIAWEPSRTAQAAAEKLDGSVAIKQYCSTCHSQKGATRRAWAMAFKKLPPDLVKGPFAYVPATADPVMRWRRFAEIIKFGLPNTDMPGYEYLSDTLISAMARRLTESSAKLKQ